MAEAMVLPKVMPGQPIVIRMNGKHEEFSYPASLKKRDKWSDLVVTCWQDDSLSIESRACNLRKESSGKRTNMCALTSEQVRMIFCIREVCNAAGNSGKKS